jgi:hypothetical protein
MKIQAWHRRHAIMIAGQLPDNPKDALLVLQATRELIEQFLLGQGGEASSSSAAAAASNVIAFSPDAGSKSPPGEPGIA